MNGARIVDLNEYPSRHVSEQTEVCIIGAGAAGIYVASGLAAKGIDVTLLEAGNSVPASGSMLLGADVQFTGDDYPGATAGRYFGIGGTTTQWGGFLIPHTFHDLRPTGEPFDAWTHIVGTVARNQAPVLKRLGWSEPEAFALPTAPPAEAAALRLRSAGLGVVSGLMMPHARKNFSCLLEEHVAARARVKLICNAVVTELEASADRDGNVSVHRVRGASRNGTVLDVVASQVVIAAGAIESARILLEFDRHAGRPRIRPTSAVGHYLADHLSIPIATVSLETRGDAIRLFAPRFERGWMRTFRFVETHPFPGSQRAFAHFTFDTRSPGFTATKEVLRAYQSRRRPNLRPGDVVRGFSDVVRLGFDRYARQRLYIRGDTEVQLQLDVEQEPRRDNRVALSERTDCFGRPVVDIDWRIGEDDIRNIEMTAHRLISMWPRGQTSFPELNPIEHVHGAAKPYDAYHPVGTCRLGHDEEAVVDETLKVHGLANVWVVSTAVLPSAGTANPTFTMLCLGEDLVDRLASRAASVTSSNTFVHA